MQSLNSIILLKLMEEIEELRQKKNQERYAAYLFSFLSYMGEGDRVSRFYPVILIWIAMKKRERIFKTRKDLH